MTPPLRSVFPNARRWRRPERLAVALLLVGFGCSSPAADSEGPGAPDAAVGTPVEVESATRGDVRDGVEGTATVAATRRAVLTARATGTVSEVAVEEGDEVRAQQRLVRLDRPELASVVAKAKAAREQAERDHETSKALLGRGLLPEARVVEAEFAARQARLEHERLLDERGLGVVTAPFVGVVTARHVQVGEAVSPGAPLLELADLTALEADLRVPERHLARLAVGQPVEVHADGLGAEPLRARVARIAPTVDARSGTVKVNVDLGSGRPDEAVDVEAATVIRPRGEGTDVERPPVERRLRPGMFVRLRVVVDTRTDVVLVHKRAIVTEEERSLVYRVADGKVTRVPVELGYEDHQQVEVRSGLVTGDQVVVFGHRGLEDGASVRVIGADAARTAGSAAKPGSEG